MKRVCFVCCAAVALLYACGPAAAGLPVKKTEKKIACSLEGKAAAVGVAVLTDGGDVLLHNGQAPLPLMSVFKFHVALCVLDKMDRNRTDPDSLLFVEAYRLRGGGGSPAPPGSVWRAAGGRAGTMPAIS